MADFGEQQIRIDWFGEIPVDANPEAPCFVLYNAQHNDGDVECLRVILEYGRYIKAIHLGHHDIEDDQVGPVLSNTFQRLFTIACFVNGVAGVAQFLVQQRAD